MAEAPLRIEQLSVRQIESPSTIYHSGPSGELRKKFLESLQGAKKSIECMTFTFSDPEILNLLLQKASEGIRVTVAIDRGHMQALLPYKDKINIVTRDEGEGRVHHKVTVIDGEQVWIGSANFSPDALLKQSNTMLHLRNKELAQAMHEEIEAFSSLRTRNPTLLPPIQVEGQTIELLLFPHVPFDAINPPEKALNEAGKQRIIDMINNAHSSIRLAVCVWTDMDLAKTVVDAKKRGVEVEVLFWKRADSAQVASYFDAAGIRVIEKPNLHLMHNKWMLVDNERFLNCSANWSKSWFSRNDESAIILNNLTPSQKQFVNDYWNELLLS